MRRIVITLLILLAAVAPAHADPVTATVASLATWYASIGVVGQTVVQIGIGLAFSAASVGLQYLLSGSGKNVDNSQQKPNVLIPERDGLLPRHRVYGRQVVPGGVFFQKTVTDTGAAGPNIYVFGVTISEGICEGLESLIINGVECQIDVNGLPITAPWNNGGNTYLKASFRSGTDSQAIDPIIAARFPTEDTNFRQRGVCTVVLEMNFGLDADHHTELWGAGGIPELGYKVKGLWLYDPRNPSHDASDKTTWDWSNTAALVEADWLNSALGFGIDFADMDGTVGASANYDEEWIPTLDGLEHRGTINGDVTSAERNVDVLDAMRQQNRAIVSRQQGVYSIRAEQPAASVCTIHQGLLVGDLTYSNEPPTRSAINRVVTEFYPEARFNQSTEIAYEDAALIAADGETLEQRVSLRFCDSPSTAQRLGFGLITENRVGRTITGAFDIAVLIAAGKPSGALLGAGDHVWFEMRSPYDTINGLYKVNTVEINGDFTVTVSMSGTSADIINGWNTGLEQALAA